VTTGVDERLNIGVRAMGEKCNLGWFKMSYLLENKMAVGDLPVARIM